MSEAEYLLYNICEKYHKYLKQRLNIKITPIEISRMLTNKLTTLEINQILHDIYLIQKRNGNVANYYVLLIYPIVYDPIWNKEGITMISRLNEETPFISSHL